MHSQTSILVSLLALTTTTFAQSTVQKLFFPATNDDAWAGRVVNVGSGLTTYAIACTSGGLSCVTGVSVHSPPTPFSIPPPLTVTAGIRYRRPNQLRRRLQNSRIRRHRVRLRNLQDRRHHLRHVCGGCEWQPGGRDDRYYHYDHYWYC